MAEVDFYLKDYVTIDPNVDCSPEITLEELEAKVGRNLDDIPAIIKFRDLVLTIDSIDGNIFGNEACSCAIFGGHDNKVNGSRNLLVDCENVTITGDDNVLIGCKNITQQGDGIIIINDIELQKETMFWYYMYMFQNVCKPIYKPITNSFDEVNDSGYYVTCLGEDSHSMSLKTAFVLFQKRKSVKCPLCTSLIDSVIYTIKK